MSNSPRLYWQSRDPASPTRVSMENNDPNQGSSPAPAKRSSIENLKRASRVKNSSMFAREQKQEYDPTSTPLVERPLASGRPLSVQPRNSLGLKAVTTRGFDEIKDFNKSSHQGVLLSSMEAKDDVASKTSPTRGQTSPGKSSLSKNSRYAQVFDPENGIWSDEEDSITERQLPPGKSLHRHAKSVTFDAAPPQVNEYEMTTPDPSSVASGSREGSFDSAEGDEDESFDRGSSFDHDDSFDASLEDTEKTPVVLPEDWKFMNSAPDSDGISRNEDDPFVDARSSPAPTVQPSTSSNPRASPTRTDSLNSNGERRPLPPLPALEAPSFPRARSDSTNSLQATAERLTLSQRVLPTPPRPASITKADLQGMGGKSMSIEERVRLMMIQDEEKTGAAKTAAEEQRERRLRRAGTPEKTHEPDAKSKEDGITIHEDEVDDDEVGDLHEHQPLPRISRESILRRVKSQKIEFEEYTYSSSLGNPDIEQSDMTSIDPDMAIPSLEDRAALTEVQEAVTIKQEDTESEVDVYSIPDLYQLTSTGSAKSSQKDDDEESHYSTDTTSGPHIPESSTKSADDEAPLKPKFSKTHDGQPDQKLNPDHRMSLPQFASALTHDDFGLSLSSYMTPSPPVCEPEKSEQPLFSQSLQLPYRPTTPEAQISPPQTSETHDEEARTPDSVIRRSFSSASEGEDSAIPEPSATIKAPGGKLKTRASLAPADCHAMAQTRRQVSGESAVPPIPEKHKNRPSVIAEGESVLETSPQKSPGNDSSHEDSGKYVKRKSSLVQLDLAVDEIDEGLSIGLDKEFDRVIEAQKVAFNLSLLDPDNGVDNAQTFSRSPKNYTNISSRAQKGYCMRQNSKVVVASSASHESNDAPEEVNTRGTRSAGCSPRKPLQTQTWTTEPWNGKARRKSIRQSGGIPSRKPAAGPVPPLPGMHSNVTNGLDSVAELDTNPEVEIFEDGAERGRLFVKVVGVKELDLPLPKGGLFVRLSRSELT